MFWFIVGIVLLIVIVAARSRRRRKTRRAPPPPRTHASLASGAAPRVFFGGGGRAKLAWAGSGASFQAGPFRIDNALTYFANGAPAQEEASCIDLRLPLRSPEAAAPDALGYWPRYATLSPEQRARYLAWLASGRRGPLADIGYAFLYFYGLERRALVDDADVALVLNEANRLMFAYAASRSFFGYSSRFIAFVLARVGLENLPRESFDTIFERTLKEYGDETLAVALAWLQQAGAPLPAFLAYEVARNDIRASRSVVVSRVAEHFRALFDKKYAERFGGGLLLKAAARERLLEYKPASPTVAGSLPRNALPGIRIPNVLGLPGQFKPLVEMWEECIEELKPVSRRLGKDGEALTREAYRALPDLLKAEVDHPDAPAWEAFVAAHSGDGNIVFTTVADLAPLCGLEPRPKLTPRQSGELASTAGDVGFALVPDFRVTGRGYKGDDLVALFRPEEGHAHDPADAKYRAATLMLELGMAVAAADGTIEQEEVDLIASFLKGQFLLAPDDARRIDAYREILVKQPPALTNLAKRLQSVLTADRLEVVCQFLVGIAAANGSIDKRERATLQRFYSAFGLPVSHLDDLIARLTGPVSEAVEVQRGLAVPGEGIPAREGEPVFTLNATALQCILQETEQVAEMLGQALSESAQEDAETMAAEAQQAIAAAGPTPSPAEPPSAAAFPAYPGLDPRFHRVVTELLSRDAWAPEDFDALARRHNLMPAGLLEAVNTWSDEQHGDFLIEEGEHYTIHRAVLEGTPCQA